MKNRKISTLGLGIAALFSCSEAVFAENLALLIANTNYRHTIQAKASGSLANTQDALESAGYRVILKRDLNLIEMQTTFDQFATEAADADRVIVGFTGHLLTTETESYLTPIDLRSPNFDTIKTTGYPISDVLAIAAEHAGGTALFLGTHREKTTRFGRHKPGFLDASGLSKRFGSVDIPQGVLVVTGRTQMLTSAMQRHFFTPNQDIETAVENAGDDIYASGYISRFSTLSPPDSVSVEPLKPIINTELMQSYWQIAQETDTITGYEDFLDRFPSGPFTDRAQKRLTALQEAARKSPEERAEIELAMTREDRKLVQQRLTVLGFDPRGIDGIFGPGSRGAISRWQASRGFKPSSFIDKNQFVVLEEQARIRAEQEAAEAERQAARERQADARFWQQTGALGSEADLRVYLRNYPDGIYSEIAREQLAVFDAKKAEQASAADKQLWQDTESIDTQRAYRNYLDQFPNGQFADLAKERLSQFSNNQERRKIIEAAKREEASLNINQGSWKLVENRLARLGLNTGKVDGVVTKETRVALRQYQKASKLPVSGYIDRRTLSTLIIGGFFK